MTDHESSAVEASERRSFWTALSIALAPIPLALLATWALGSPPPWRPRPAPAAASPSPSPTHPGHEIHR